LSSIETNIYFFDHHYRSHHHHQHHHHHHHHITSFIVTHDVNQPKIAQHLMNSPATKTLVSGQLE